MARKDHTDKKYGRLLVIREVGKNKSGRYLWECRCDCGKITNVVTNQFVSGKTKSCGCLLFDKIPKNKIKDRIEQLWNVVYNELRRRHFIKFEIEPISIGKFIELSKSECYYCGRINDKKRFDVYDKSFYIEYNGIDRLNSKIGYIRGNVVSCCRDCNCSKMDMDIETFLSKVKAIYEFRINNSNYASI